MTNLTEQRAALEFTLKYKVNPNAFPSSKAGQAYRAAKQALADFDAAHPEIKAASEAEKKAAWDARQNRFAADPESLQNRIARGTD